MSHSLIKGARPGEVDVIARMTVAEERAESPLVRADLGGGLRREFDDQFDEPGDDVHWDAPCPDE